MTKYHSFNYCPRWIVSTIFSSVMLISSVTTETLVPEIELSRQEVVAYPPRYVPSQTLLAYPERMLPSYQNITSGIKELSPDNFKPIPGGMALIPDKNGTFIIHHRRGGVSCDPNLVLRLRLEMVRNLSTLRLAMLKNGQFTWLSDANLKSLVHYPGRVIYELEDLKQQMALQIEVVAPASTKAYGFIARVSLTNLSPNEADFKLVALGSAGENVAPELSTTKLDQITLELDCSKAASGVKPKVPYDTAIKLLLGWDGDASVNETVANACLRHIKLKGKENCTVQLTAFLDSPGYDEKVVRQQIEPLFNHNLDLSEEVRRRMLEEALETHVRIIVEGKDRFEQVRNDLGQAYKNELKSWENGVFRNSTVSFEMSDKKMESVANQIANDLFPGLVQPPGIVHDAKLGDQWNYIFSYRHIHAASDIGLESKALDYLNLISMNRKPDGRLASLKADFKSDGHPTLFEESYIDSLWHYYKWTGDLEAVKKLWPSITLAANRMDTTLDPDGDNLYKDTLHQWKSDFDNRGPSSAFQTALVRKAYQDLADFAEALGFKEEAMKYKLKAEAIYQAAQKELWSNDYGIFGSKCPLGLLRLHPQSLDVDIPIWTKMLNPYQGIMQADWFLNNSSFTDKQGGLYFYHNNWWPVVWSQHMPSQSDMMMTAWGLMLSGRHEEGARTLATSAAIAYRAPTPGFDFVFYSNGTGDTWDPATCQGAFLRALVEGIFGVAPHLDKQYIVVRPRFPEDWTHARFSRPGLDIRWNREGNTQTFKVKTAPNVQVHFEIPVKAPLEQLIQDGKILKQATAEPEMCWSKLKIKTGLGGGEIKLVTEDRAWDIKAPKEIEAGSTAEIRVSGLSSWTLEDPYSFFEILKTNNQGATVKLKRAGCGQVTLFIRAHLNGKSQPISWIEPLTFTTLPKVLKDVVKRTVLDPLPIGSRAVPLDLSSAYNESLQTIFLNKFHTDAGVQSDKISFWTMPMFQLKMPLPQQLTVGNIPFHCGDMGSDLKGKNLIMLCNTAPREKATSAKIKIEGRNLHKVYLLSLNMNLPMKTYVPAARVTVRYTDGTAETTDMIPPINFDSYYQDFGLNTLAMPMDSAEPGHGQTKWANYYQANVGPMHLTMTDIICNPTKKTASIELSSVATETFMAIAGVTLLEAENQ